jgi:WD40 repeat protein
MTINRVSIGHPNSIPTSAVIGKNTSLLHLPLELIINILKSLNVKEVSRCNLLCKQLNQILSVDENCQDLFSCHFPHINSEGIKGLSRAYRGLCSGLTKGVYASRIIYGTSPFIIFDGGKKLISHSGADSNYKIKVWDLQMLICTARIDTGVIGRSIASVISDGEKLMASFIDDKIKIWDLQTSICTQPLVTYSSGNLIIFDNGRKLISSSNDIIKIFDLENFTEITSLEGDRTLVPSLVISDDGTRLISAGFGNDIIKIWNLETFTCIASLKGNGDPIGSLIISNDKRQLISGSDKGVIKIWDLETLTCIATLKGHTDSIKSLAVFDDWRLISGSDKGVIKIWDLETFTCLVTLRGCKGWVDSLAISYDGKLIAGSCEMIKIFDFTASSIEIFEEIADLFNSGDPEKIEEALERFSKMPETEKNEIYGKLYAILKLKPSLENDYWGCAEHAFHGRYGQKATCGERAEAITKYVQERKQERK